MITDVNYNLSLQVTYLLVNSHKGYLAFHSPPFGGGEGGRGQLWSVALLVVFSFLQQALSKYRVLNILLVFKYEAGNDGTQ